LQSKQSGSTNHQAAKIEKSSSNPEEGQPGSTDRLLVLSDGLFAIAITLLVLDLKVPKVEAGVMLPSVHQIGMAFLAQWPTYFAYLMSFLNIGVLWNNHVTAFRYIRRCDHTLTMLNLLLMLCISVNPFITSLLAEYLVLSPAHREVAMLIFSGTWFVTAVFFNILWFYAAKDRRLLDLRISASHYQDVSNRYKYGPAVYLGIFLLSVVGLPVVSLVLSAVLSLFYALPYNASKVIAEAELLEGETQRRLLDRVVRRR
jgi:uncharacterized membrane protein